MAAFIGLRHAGQVGIRFVHHSAGRNHPFWGNELAGFLPPDEIPSNVWSKEGRSPAASSETKIMLGMTPPQPLAEPCDERLRHIRLHATIKTRSRNDRTG